MDLSERPLPFRAKLARPMPWPGPGDFLCQLLVGTEVEVLQRSPVSHRLYVKPMGYRGGWVDWCDLEVVEPPTSEERAWRRLVSPPE